MILIVAKMRVKPEHAAAWPALMEQFTAATRAEPGNVSFDWSRSIEDPNELVLVEAFRDGAAGEAHVGSEHFQAAMALLPDLIDGIPDIVNVEVPGDAWSKMAELRVDEG